MKKIIFIFILVLSKISGDGQDINFSQFHQLPMLRNPALIGLSECNIEVKTVYRNQWERVTEPYNSAGLSAQYHFAKEISPLSSKDYNPWAVGVQLTYDVAGDSKLKRTAIIPLAASYSLKYRDNIFITLGATGGFVSSRFDNSKLRWDNQYQNGQYYPSIPGEPIGQGATLVTTEKKYFDLASGLVLSGKTEDNDNLFYVGGAIYHINTPDVSFTGVPQKLYAKKVLNAGYSRVLGEDVSLTFYGDYFWQGTKFAKGQSLMGLFLSYGGTFTGDIGCIYRQNDALIPSIRIDMGIYFMIGFSYDINVSRLSDAQNRPRSMEFTLTIHSCKRGGRGSNFGGINGGNEGNSSGIPCPIF